MRLKPFKYILLAVIILLSIKTDAYALVTQNANFEDGTFDSLTGNSTWEGPLGSYFGKGVFYDHEIVSSPAIGNYSAAITIGSGPNTASYLFSYVSGATTTGYGRYRASFFVPSDTVPSDWWNIWQWKSMNTEYNKPVIDLNLVEIGGILQLRMSHNIGGTSTFPTQLITQTSPVAFPTDTWVEIKGEYTAKEDSTGGAVIYQNNIEIFRIENIVTLPGGDTMFWSINSYADEIFPNPTTIYIDNMIVEEVDSFSIIEDPDPDPDPDPDIDLEEDPETNPEEQETTPTIITTTTTLNTNEKSTLPKAKIFKNTALNIILGIFLITCGIYTYTIPKSLSSLEKFENKILKRIGHNK